ncbi:hypothetical protein PQX77_002285 [Marasmius sp. AFHP31]|nr:hypothetical protein PQX77_002285 [Marasmius sp. AFHP31]
MDGSENKVYKRLEDISSAVVDVAKKVWTVGQQPTVRFIYGGEELILPDSEKDILDSVTTAKFKKTTGKESLNDNVRKLLENATHMMFSDPRRRFRFGITIEDTQMRFWHFSRAWNSVTHDLSFITNPKPFIQFLLGTSFATPVELGYDPTVVRLNVDDYYVEHPKDGTQWYGGEKEEE